VLITAFAFTAARVAVAVVLGLALRRVDLPKAEVTEGPGQECADRQAASRHRAERPRQRIKCGVFHGNLL
jgi:hypothetical protein